MFYVSLCVPLVTGPISTAQQKLRELPMETLKALVLQWQKIFLNCNDESGLVPSDTVLNVAPVRPGV